MAFVKGLRWRERRNAFFWRHGYEEWSDIPRFAWYAFDHWSRRTLCRIFGHKPSRETTWGVMESGSTTVWGHPEMSRSSTEHWTEVRRTCPRCYELENKAKLKYKRVDHEPPDNTIQWSEQSDPTSWE